MKILIVQQLAWGIHIGHDLAKVLHGRGHRLSALVVGVETKKFLESKGSVPYDHLYLADPIYDKGFDHVTEDVIAQIEDRYSLASVWNLISSDRLLIYSFVSSRRFTYRRPKSNEYLLSVCMHAFSHTREIVEEIQPTFVIAPNIGYLITYLLYLECKYQKIPFYTLSYSGFANYLFVGDDEYSRGSHVRARYEDLRVRPQLSEQYNEACDVYRQMLENPASQKLQVYLHRDVLKGLHLFRRFLYNTAALPARLVVAATKGRRVFDIKNIWLPNNSILNQLRNVWINSVEEFVKTDNQGECIREVKDIVFDYVFYPLQFEPELDLMVWTPEFSNQMELCRRIAMSLPRGVRLLVKEHPAMVSSRRRTYYEKLKRLPNVELIHSSVSAREIFTSARCRVTAVLSSTVGFEAAINGCPVVLLGPAGYEVLPWVTRVTTLEDTSAALRKVCTNPERIDKGEIERSCVAYIAAVLENSFSGDYHKRWLQGAGDACPEAIADKIEERFQKE